MRLINAESPQNRMYVSDLVIEEMKKIPTVDIDRPTRRQFKRMAVQLGYEQVVHCKDCEHKDTWTESKIRDWFWCGVSGLQVVEDMDFCSYGERRTDEQ